MKISKHIILSVFFSILITLPMLFSTLSVLTGKPFDLPLKGFFDESHKPEFSASSYIKSDYQRNFESYLNQSIKPRVFFIKLYNQIQYSLFGLSNRIVGKNGYIFEYDYINAACGLTDECDFSIAENQLKVKEYVKHLESIQNKLSKKGKTFIFYTTPSKAEYYYDMIPLKYLKNARKNLVTGYEFLKEELENSDINYIDSRDFIPAGTEFPVFYKSGIHWSRPIEQILSQALQNKMTLLSGKNLPKLIYKDLNGVNTPYWRDSDVFDLTNIFEKTSEQYFQYNMVYDENFPYEPPRVLLQGGSFADGLRFDYLDSYSDKFFYIFYKEFVSNPEYGRKITDWSDLELKKYLDETDFVIVEINESRINKFSDGFVEYLDAYLDTYIPDRQGKRITNYERFDNSKKISPPCKNGFYYFEDLATWVKPESRIFLKNENIKEKGLRVSFIIPTEVSGKKMNLKIVVNGRCISDRTFTVPNESVTLLFPANEFQDDADSYDIKLLSDFSFIPKELGINDDSRLLSFLVKYIGEAG